MKFPRIHLTWGFPLCAVFKKPVVLLLLVTQKGCKSKSMEGRTVEVKCKMPEICAERRKVRFALAALLIFFLLATVISVIAIVMSVRALETAELAVALAKAPEKTAKPARSKPVSAAQSHKARYPSELVTQV